MASSSRANRPSALGGRPRYSQRQYHRPVEINKYICTALSEDGKDCPTEMDQPHYRFCHQHYRELQRMYALYKLREKEYESISVDAGDEGKIKRQEKMKVGEEVIRLRDAVTRRFHSLNADNRGHFQWILRLRSEIDELKKTAQDLHEPSDHLTPEPGASEAEKSSEGKGGVWVRRSLISPEVPMSALDHFLRDSPVVVIKSALIAMTKSLVERLYKIVPSLDDSRVFGPDDSSVEEQNSETNDLVIRYIFREYLVWKADTETLARASRTSTVDQFFRQSSGEELQDYIRLFEVLGSQDTLHFLRDAVYDYLLPVGSPSTTMILGAAISTDNAGHRMTVEAWDILHKYFWNLIGWWNVEQLCFSFEDLVLVKRLIALRRYGDSEDAEASWYHPEDDVSQEHEMAVLQGFVGLSKGFCDASYQQFVTQPGTITEVEARSYLVGRMAKADPLASLLIKEIASRIGRFVVIAMDMERIDWGYSPSDRQDGEELPFIRRTRSARVKDGLPDAEWEVEWSVKDILADVRRIRATRERDSFTDFHIIIIIERSLHTVGKQFTILQEMAEALKEVGGDRSSRDIVDQAITESIPAPEQTTWKEAFLPILHSSLVDPGDSSPHYEEYRVRQWDIGDHFPDFARSHAERPRSYSDIRFIRKILAEMDLRKVITLLETFEAPHSTPMLYHSIDGQQDLFFPYKPASPVDDDAIQKLRFMSPEVNMPPESLYDFARSYSASHPDAVFAKGKFHVHYCAWPLKIGDRHLPNFHTAEGHIYRWNALPFDYLHSTRMWQLYLHMIFNQKLSFVRCLHTTFVVCAESMNKAEGNLRVLAEEAAKKELRLSVKPVSLWNESAFNRRLKQLKISKNSTGTHTSTASRHKPHGIKERPPLHVPEDILSQLEFRLRMWKKPVVPTPMNTDRFRHHERLIDSIDRFTYGIFSKGSKGWSHSISAFLTPTGIPSPSTHHWRILAGRFYSASCLVRADLHGKAEAAFEQMLNDFQAWCICPHPAFIVVFWRVCLGVLGINSHLPRSKPFRRFLKAIQVSQDAGSPVITIVDSLDRLDPEDLRDALRVGYVKAIRTLTAVIGDENVMVLDMVSFFCRFFTTPYLLRETLKAKLEHVLGQVDEVHNRSSTEWVAIQYSSAYASYYARNECKKAFDQATDLRKTVAQLPCLAKPAYWSLETEAFSWASNVIAQEHRAQVKRAGGPMNAPDEYAKCCASLQSAIMMLEGGDGECRARALLASRNLNRWLVEWNRKEEAVEEGLRTRTIEDSIPGNACWRCERGACTCGSTYGDIGAARRGALHLDEFSSGVDHETDRSMQKIIQEEFRNYTVIMVSHRLDMVIEFDTVLMMDGGSIVETGRPSTLIETKGFSFRELWMVRRKKI
ncbi:hypothetical protein diail_2872 [Diaporthe ilicicola]|nr:hypothetical protein diail_2872 [Diaporthe ilicicola]